MGCERADTRLKSGSGYVFIPTDPHEIDPLRSALVQAGQALPVSGVSGTWQDPDVVFISGEHVRDTLHETQRSLGEGLMFLAFGSEQGEFRKI